MKLVLLEQSLSVYRFEPSQAIPEKLWSADFLTISKTHDELSIVVSDDVELSSEQSSPDWFGFYVEGPLPHDMIGVMAKLSDTLAAAKCSIFTIATYDTDYILVQNSQRTAALSALTAAGYRII